MILTIQTAIVIIATGIVGVELLYNLLMTMGDIIHHKRVWGSRIIYLYCSLFGFIIFFFAALFNILRDVSKG